MNCDNITSKKFQLSQKKSNPLVQVIIALHLACVTIITKCLRCNAIASPVVNRWQLDSKTKKITWLSPGHGN